MGGVLSAGTVLLCNNPKVSYIVTLLYNNQVADCDDMLLVCYKVVNEV